MKKTSYDRRQGFTWLEMLAVTFVCLVAFLLIIPFFAHHNHHNGHGLSCSTNMKQIGLGLLQYAQDNNNELPNGTQPTPGLGWVGQVYPYVKSTGLFQCPDDTTENTSPSANVLSYAYNSNIPKSAYHIPTWLYTQTPVVNIAPNPTQLILCFEVTGDQFQLPSSNTESMDEGAAQGARVFSAAGDGTASGLHSTMHGNDPIHYATGDLGGRSSGAHNQFDEARHQGGSEYLMADGHIKWLKPEVVSTGTDAPSPYAAQTGAISGTAAGTAYPNYAATFSVK